jgi:hypothetical protein
VTGLALALSARAAEPEAVQAPDELLDIGQTAELLRTTKDSLYRKRKRQRLGYIDPLDGRLKFTKAELQTYIRRQGRKP